MEESHTIPTLLLLGNGFDISLGIQTEYKYFVRWVKETASKELKSEKLSKNRKKILENTIYFINAYEAWDKNNIEKIWSDLENDILYFFDQKNRECRNKEKQENNKHKQKTTQKMLEKLIEGYSFFCFLMQEYYIRIINKNKSIKQEQKKETKNKIERFDCLAGRDCFFNIISLNYTFPYDFLDKKRSPLKNKTKISEKFYFLHYIIFSNNLYDFSSSLLNGRNDGNNHKNFRRFGNVKNLSDLSCRTIDSHTRDNISSPMSEKINVTADQQLIQMLENFKSSIEEKIASRESVNDIVLLLKGLDVKDFLKDVDKSKKFAPLHKYHYFQSLILGNELVTKNVNYDDLKFLSKNSSPFLCVEDYPKQIIDLIDSKINFAKITEGKIATFGYSFGKADHTLNSWIKGKLENGWALEICFWKEDEGQSFIKETELRIKEVFPKNSYEIIFW